MPRFEVCVIGDNVDQGAQCLSIDATTLIDFEEAIRRSARFSPPDYNKITSLKRLNTVFNEWVSPKHDLSDLGQNEKIHLFTEKNTESAVDAIFYELLWDKCVVASLRGMGRDEAQILSMCSALRDAKLLFRSKRGLPEEEDLWQRLQRDLGDTMFDQGAGGRRPTQQREAARSNKSAPPRDDGTRASEAFRTVSQSTTPQLSARKTTAPVSEGSVPVATVPVTTVPVMPSAAGDTLTVYCVYTGTTSQRAKAIRISRSYPSVDLLLGPLRAKFHADLALGFIAEDGSCSELLTDGDLMNVVRALPPNAESLTLHCWARTTVTFDEANNTAASTGQVSGYSSADEQSVASSRKSVNGGMRKSVRPGSATGSVRSNKSVRSTRDKIEVTSSNPLDVSGVALTEEQLRSVFDALDVDGSGELSKKEFYKYFTQSYDSMGIPNFKKKIQDLLDSAPEFSDGMLSFREFCVVMLKVAQW